MLLSAEQASAGRVRIYRDATVLDGTGRDRYRADVAVEGALVVAIIDSDDERTLDVPPGAVEIDAHGLVLAPGFIDMHARSALASRTADTQAKLRQGVTTEVIGQDDLLTATDAATTVNVAALVPLENLREMVIGHETRPATPDELERMCALLGAALDAGAFGMSGRLTDTLEAEAFASELEALGRVIAERGGCQIHLPEVTTFETDALSLEEVVQLRSATPARRLGLDRGDAPRGVIREGATADLVLFDPPSIAAAATHDGSHAPALRVVEVLVDGIPVVADGEVTSATPGRMLRMPPPPHRATVPHIDAVIDEQAPPFLLQRGAAVSAPEALTGTATILREKLGLGDATDAVQIVLRIDEGLGGEEAFRIDVTADRVELTGAAPVGVFRAAMTFVQLCPPEGVPDGGTACIPAGSWHGEPAHGWRGAMLDVARHFRPADDIRRLIDLLAAHHLNVLHLHLTDDQGWRYEVPGYPRLTEIGARREATQRGHGPLATVEPGVHEGFFTTAELRALVDYAAERFITLVPEVELPGHVQAALAAYPELGNTDAGEPVTAPWERFGVNPRVLAPTDEALAFGRAAIDALCDIFDSSWIGIGGDEVPVDEWAQSPAVAEWMKQTGVAGPHAVQPWFTRHFVEHVRSRGRTPLAWDEVLEGEVPDGVRILAWRGPLAMAEALRRGIPIIGCPDLEVYLDYRQSESADEPVPVGPPLTLERAYSLTLPDGVVGGQANTWTEHLPTRDRVDYAMFPRLSAIAERLWAGGEPGDVDDFLRRLPVHLRRLASAGVQYRQLHGPTPDQRRTGVPGKPMSVADRERIVEELVAGLRLAQTPVRKVY